MGKNKAQVPTLARIRYMSCFDSTHAPVATAARAAATEFVVMRLSIPLHSAFSRVTHKPQFI